MLARPLASRILGEGAVVGGRRRPRLGARRLAQLLAFVLGGAWGPRLEAAPYRADPDLMHQGAPDPEATSRDVVLRDRKFRAQMRMQLQLELGDESNGKDVDAVVRRSRPILSYKPDDSWSFRAEANVDDEDVEVRDLYGTLRLKRWSRLWIGQFKSVLSRSFLGSSGALLFTERSLAIRTFIDSSLQTSPTNDFDRLLGHGGARAPRLRLTHYWYFDEGDRTGDELGIRLRAEAGKGSRSFDVEGGWNYTVRLEIHPDGNPAYREGNLRAGRQGRLSFDMAYHRDPHQEAVDLDGDGLVTPADRFSREIGNVGWLYRRDRFSTQAEFLRQHLRPANSPVETISSGRYIQAGWVWRPRRWESGLRYSVVDPDRGRSGDLREERAFSLVRYFDENLTKALVEVVRVDDQARPGSKDTLVRLQYQVTF